MAAVEGEGNSVTIRITGTSAEAVGAIAQVNESLAQLIARSREAAEATGNIGRAIGGSGGSGIIGSGFTGSGLGGGVLGAFGALGQGILGVVGHLGTFVSGWAQMQLALMGNQAFFAATEAVHTFAEAIWDLSNATEKNTYSWRYTYGQGMKPEVAMANAQAISAWGQKFSRDIPFTEQDFMTSISGAATMGLNLQGLQKYYPMIADLAATHINPMTGQPLDLGQAVMAIRGEMQLNINPEELVPYGLAYQGRGIGGHITDMTTLLPALKAYSEKQGWTQYDPKTGKDVGAAYETAHHTWWGELSSFTDRLNALQLMLGGTDPKTMTQYDKGFFPTVKKDLEGISAWWDAHQQGIWDMGRIFGDLFGAGAKGGTMVLQGIFQGVTGSGIGTGILDNVKKLTDWLNDPSNQQALKDFGTTIGTNLAEAARKTGDSFTVLAGGIDRLNQALGGAKGDANIFQGIIDVLTAIPAQLGRFAKTWGDFLAFLSDIKNGDWDKAQQDLGAWLQDSASYLTTGVLPGSNISGQSGGSWGAEGRSRPAPPPHYVGNPHNLISSLYGANSGGDNSWIGSFTGFTGGSNVAFQQGQTWMQMIAAGMQAGKAQVRGQGEDVGRQIGEAIARGMGQSAGTKGGGSAFEAAIKRIVQHELAVAEQSLAATPGAFFSRGQFGGQY